MKKKHKVLCLLLMLAQSIVAQKHIVGGEIEPFYPFLSTKTISHHFWELNFERNLSLKSFSFSKKEIPGVKANVFYGIRIVHKKHIDLFFHTSVGIRYYNYELDYNGDYTNYAGDIQPFSFEIKKNLLDLTLGQNILVKTKSIVIVTGLIPMVNIVNQKRFSYKINNSEIINEKTPPTPDTGVGLGPNISFKIAYNIQLGYSFLYKKLEIIPSVKASLALYDGEKFSFGQAKIRRNVSLNTLGVSIMFLCLK